MTTLREDLQILVKTKDKVRLTEIKEIFEDTRDSVFAVLDAKLDKGQPIVYEQQSIQQINHNILLVKEAINSIK